MSPTPSAHGRSARRNSCGCGRARESRPSPARRDAPPSARSRACAPSSSTTPRRSPAPPWRCCASSPRAGCAVIAVGDPDLSTGAFHGAHADALGRLGHYLDVPRAHRRARHGPPPRRRCPHARLSGRGTHRRRSGGSAAGGGRGDGRRAGDALRSHRRAGQCRTGGGHRQDAPRTACARRRAVEPHGA